MKKGNLRIRVVERNVRSTHITMIMTCRWMRLHTRILNYHSWLLWTSKARSWSWDKMMTIVLRHILINRCIWWLWLHNIVTKELKIEHVDKWISITFSSKVYAPHHIDYSKNWKKVRSTKSSFKVRTPKFFFPFLYFFRIIPEHEKIKFDKQKKIPEKLFCVHQ